MKPIDNSIRVVLLVRVVCLLCFLSVIKVSYGSVLRPSGKHQDGTSPLRRWKRTDGRQQQLMRDRRVAPFWTELKPMGNMKIDRTNKKEVKLAVILPYSAFYLFSIHYSAPAVQYAIEVVQSENYLPSHYLRARYADSQCNTKDAPINAFNFYMSDQVDVFLGPVCDFSLAPVARYSPYWNLPAISPGGLASDFAEKEDEYSLLTRVGSTFNSLAIYILDVLSHFNFRKVKIIYTIQGNERAGQRYCYLSTASVVGTLRRQSFDHHVYLFPDEKTEDFGDMLKNEVGTKYSGMLDVNHWIGVGSMSGGF